MYKNIILIMAFVLLSIDSYAQEGTTDKMEKLISEMGGLSSTDYILKIDNYREKLERFIENKKGVCEGEFSTVILSRNDRVAADLKKPVKLTKEERAICFRELKQVQKKYIEASYEAKKRYLIYLHKMRLKELSLSKNNAIKELTNRFNKKGHR